MPTSKCVLVCVTAQSSCIDIIKEGKKLAKNLNAVTEVVTVQPKEADAKTRAEAMKCLQELSKLTDCQVSVIYSDNVLKSLSSFTAKLKPVHIFTGIQAEDSELLIKLSMLSNSPISMVAKENEVFTLPTNL